MTAPCVISAGTVIEDFSDHTDWTADSGIYTLTYGFKSIDDPGKRTMVVRRALTSSPASAGYVTKTGLSLNLSDMTTLRLDFSAGFNSNYFGGVTRVTLEFSSTGSFGSKSMTSVGTGQNIPPTFGPVRWTLGTSDFTAIGGESWSNTMVAMRIGIHLAVTTNGSNCGPYFHFDKLVKNPQNTPLVLVSVDTSLKADTDITSPILAEYGFSRVVSSSLIDYDNMGDTNYNTPAQLTALQQSGMQMIPCHTAWLLQTPQNTDGWPLRTVPPFPAEDTDYVGCDDSQPSNSTFSAWHWTEIMNRIRAIHDWYGWGYGNIWQTHGLTATTVESLEAMHRTGLYYLEGRADWSSATNKQIGYMSLPVPDRAIYFWAISNGLATHSDVLTAIDECIARGTYLGLSYSNNIATNWSESDFDAEMAYLRAKEDAGLLRVVSLTDFINLTTEQWPADDTPHNVTLGAINLNDQVNYFVDSEGMNLGQRQTTWEEIPSYVASQVDLQVNVRRSSFVAVTIPMWVVGTSVSDLNGHLASLWSEVDKASNRLSVDDETFNIVYSTRPETVERDNTYEMQYRAYFTLVLMRSP